AGCVRKVVSYYAGGGFGTPVTPSFRKAAERGDIEVWECEEGILCAGLQAAAQALPFLPWRGGVGTSLPLVNSDLKVFTEPIKGETLIAVPRIKPDDAILRVPYVAHPFYSRGFYVQDDDHLKAYSQAANDAAGGDSGALGAYLNR